MTDRLALLRCAESAMAEVDPALAAEAVMERLGEDAGDADALGMLARLRRAQHQPVEAVKLLHRATAADIRR